MFKEWVGRDFFFFFLGTFKEWVGRLGFFKCEIQYLWYIRTVTVYKNNITHTVTPTRTTFWVGNIPEFFGVTSPKL